MPESEDRKYEDYVIDLPLERTNTTLFVHYHCDEEGYASLNKPTRNLEKLPTLRNITFQNSFYLRQNETFTCLGIRRFQGAFCFSNSTSAVSKLYHTTVGFIMNYYLSKPSISLQNSILRLKHPGFTSSSQESETMSH